jgi:phosphoadenylyl-sulfate reductase (thioredoxin)
MAEAATAPALQEDAALLERLEAMAPEDLLQWAFDTHGERVGILTSFQTTGCVTIDIAQQVAPGLRVITVDTLRLPPETYAFMERVETHYGITIERFKPDPDHVKRMIEQHGEFLFFDSKAKQEFCCGVRKVQPNNRALETVGVWISGLRRDMSAFRKNTPKAAYVDHNGRTLLKLNPLVEWTEDQIWDYIKANDVPYSPLYDQGYTSIGCVICTTPTKPWEDKRAGRWRWFNEEDDNKECGIHIGGSGI